MSRDVKEVLKSGYVTKAERLAMDFENALESNEEHMGEQAAIGVTCEQFGVAYDDYAEILMEMPDGDWWEAQALPVRGQAA